VAPEFLPKPIQHAVHHQHRTSKLIHITRINLLKQQITQELVTLGETQLTTYKKSNKHSKPNSTPHTITTQNLTHHSQQHNNNTPYITSLQRAHHYTPTQPTSHYTSTMTQPTVKTATTKELTHLPTRYIAPIKLYGNLPNTTNSQFLIQHNPLQNSKHQTPTSQTSHDSPVYFSHKHTQMHS
jgi:hypothetical protein